LKCTPIRRSERHATSHDRFNSQIRSYCLRADEVIE
jgi:hypothetical protein